jgi:ribose transport system substrate-binding protein
LNINPLSTHTKLGDHDEYLPLTDLSMATILKPSISRTHAYRKDACIRHKPISTQSRSTKETIMKLNAHPFRQWSGFLALGLFCIGAIAQNERIAVMTTDLTNPHFQLVRAGADAAAKQMGVTIKHYVPTKPHNIPEQMSQVEDVIVTKPNAVVIVPVDFKAMVPAFEKMNAAGIPLVNTTSKTAGGNFASFVGASDYDLGLSTGRHLIKALNGKGNIVIIEGIKGNRVSMDRVDGFMAALKESPQVKLIASQPGGFQRLPASQVTENLLQAHPVIDGIMVANDAMASGVIEALDGANRKSLVVGINGTKEAIDAIRAGKLLASADYSSFNQGCVSAMAAVRAARKLSVPKEFVFPVTLVDRSNADRFDIATQGRACPAWESVVR